MNPSEGREERNDSEESGGERENSPRASIPVSPRDHESSRGTKTTSPAHSLTQQRSSESRGKLSTITSKLFGRSKSTSSLRSRSRESVECFGSWEPSSELKAYYDHAFALDEDLTAMRHLHDAFDTAAHVFTQLSRRDASGYQKVDALPVLRSGTAFLKCSKSGSPHFRLLKLSEDLRLLTYFSPEKSKEVSVDLRSDASVMLGQHASFAGTKTPRGLALASMSILHEKHGKRESLDLIAKDARELAVWSDALGALCRGWRETPDEVSGWRSIEVKIPYLPPTAFASFLVPIRYFCGPLEKLGFFDENVIQRSPPPIFSSHVERGRRMRVRLDVMGVVREGTHFAVWLGADRLPRYLRLALAPQQDALVLYSQDITNPKLVVPFAEITRIVVGQTTNRFARVEAPRVLAQVSFSILVAAGDSVDLIAHSLDAFELWTLALSALLRAAQSSGPAHQGQGQGQGKPRLDRLLIHAPLPFADQGVQRIKDSMRTNLGLEVEAKECFLQVNISVDPNDPSTWIDPEPSIEGTDLVVLEAEDNNLGLPPIREERGLTNSSAGSQAPDNPPELRFARSNDSTGFNATVDDNGQDEGEGLRPQIVVVPPTDVGASEPGNPHSGFLEDTKFEPVQSVIFSTRLSTVNRSQDRFERYVL